MKPKILLVDDEEKVVSALKMHFDDAYEVFLAHSGKTGLEKIEAHGPFAVVISDLRMPQMDGSDFLQRVKEISPLTVRAVLTGYADVGAAIELVNKGQIFRFLTKPCAVEDVKRAIEASVEQFRLLTAEKDILHRTVCGTVEVLTEILSLLDPLEFSQVPKKRDLVVHLCANLGVRDPFNVVLATMLSSIGAATVPAPVLLRIRASTEISEVDVEVLDKMYEVGGQLLQKIPRLEKAADIIRGQRYRIPSCNEKERAALLELIPVGARILRVVNDFMTMQMNGMSELEALKALEKNTSQYDSKVLDHLAVRIQQEQPSQKVVMERPVKAAEITANQTLARDALTLDGVLVVPAKTVLGDSTLSKLLNYAKLIGLSEPLYIYG